MAVTLGGGRGGSRRVHRRRGTRVRCKKIERFRGTKEDCEQTK